MSHRPTESNRKRSSSTGVFREYGSAHGAPSLPILNAYWEPLEFELPPVADGGRHPWRRWVDTFLDSPHDIVEWEQAPSVPGHTYRAEPRSVVVPFADLEPGRRP